MRSDNMLWLHSNNHTHVVPKTYSTTELNLEKTVNTEIFPTFEGKSWQANANPTPENPSPIIVSGGSDVVVTDNATRTVTMPLPEGFGGVGDVSDRIYSSGGKVWWEKKTDEIILDGSADELWFYQTTNNTSIKRLANRDLVNKIKPSADRVAGNILSNFYVKRSATECYAKTVGISVDASSSITIYDEFYNTPTSLDGYKALLSVSNLTVRYELATPQLIDITDTPTGIEYLKLQTYYSFTHIYSAAQAEVKATITAEIKQF